MDAASVEAEIASLKVRVRELERRCHALEDEMDTFVKTPLWKKIVFVLDGWPLRRIAPQPQWRPWRGWLRS